MKVLSNPDRLLLLCHMTDDECCVGQLEQQTGIVQPTLSQQLTVLRREGLVSTRRDGKRIHYRLAHPPALAVLQLLQSLYCCRSEASGASFLPPPTP
jgi:ArsR family transcriptional regulator